MSPDVYKKFIKDIEKVKGVYSESYSKEEKETMQRVKE